MTNTAKRYDLIQTARGGVIHLLKVSGTTACGRSFHSGGFEPWGNEITCKKCIKIEQAKSVIEIKKEEAEMETGTYQGKTADEWRAMAKASRSRSIESFERCDTDGALSQWGSDMMAQQYRLSAHVAEQDGWWEFRALFDTSGNLLDAREIQTRYGWAWAISTANGTVWFNQSQARKGERRFAADSKKGYLLGTVKRRAFVKLAGGSMLAVSAVVVPDQYDDRYEIVDNGTSKSEYHDFN